MLTSVVPTTSLLAPRRISPRFFLRFGLTSLFAPSDDQLAGDEACLLTHHFLLADLLYVLVGSVISFVDVVGNLQLHLGLVRLLLIPVSPRVRARGLLSRSRHSGDELDSLSRGSEKELIQLVDRRLDGSDHIL